MAHKLMATNPQVDSGAQEVRYAATRRVVCRITTWAMSREAALGLNFRSCRHPGCQLAGVKFCRCFGRRVVRPPSYVVWATPTHPSRLWAVGHEIRPGCLKVVAYSDSKVLADALAQQLSDD